MGNVFGKYGEWEVTDDGEIDEEMDVEPTQLNTDEPVNVELAPIAASEEVIAAEVSEKPSRKTRSNSGLGSNSDVSPVVSPKPTRGRTNSGLFKAQETTQSSTETTEEIITEQIEIETLEVTVSPKPRSRTNSGLKASVEIAKVKKGRTNSALQDSEELTPTVEETVEEEEEEEEDAIEEETVELESPKAKRKATRANSHLKRKRSSGSFSTVVSVVENTPSITVESPVRATEKRAKVDKIAIKADVVGGTFPTIIDQQNYSTLTKEELINQPRRSLRQTPLKDVQATPSSRSTKKARAPKSPVKQERTPSPKRKLFATPKKDSLTQTPSRRGRKPSKKALGVD